MFETNRGLAPDGADELDQLILAALRQGPQRRWIRHAALREGGVLGRGPAEVEGSLRRLVDAGHLVPTFGLERGEVAPERDRVRPTPSRRRAPRRG
jgi:hypothetical protein